MDTESTDTTPVIAPVKVSSTAYAALLKNIRRWSGWGDARLVLGEPEVGSPYALTDTLDRSFTVNVDALLLNPNRVLRTINPFRLRQEAVLTGAMLHEAGHARHSRWLPCGPDAAPVLHSDGTAPSEATIGLARLMEEARIEGLIAGEEAHIGAKGLGWTMRATAAYLLPTTRLTISDPNVALMELIESWAKRAGRQIALAHHVDGYEVPSWANDFTSLLSSVIADHLLSVTPEPDLDSLDVDDVFGAPTKGQIVTANTQRVLEILRNMVKHSDDTGSTMIDYAREVLEILFPETDPEDMPVAGGGCDSTEPEPESDDESAEQGEGGAEAQSEGDEAGDGTGEGEGEGSGPEDGDGEGSGSEQADDGSGMAEDYPGLTNKQANVLADLQAALEDTEAKAEKEVKAESHAKAAEVPEAPDADPNIRGAGGGGSAVNAGWRTPRAEEWETSRNASRFLRDLIDPTENSIVSLTDSPSAQVDAAALSAWRAGGQRRDPRFFVRTRRDVTPAPPVKVAVLVDVSQSMGVLQKPSALLSWALANAVTDLRNFAGRGQQVESCLIHWGNTARVIQRNGETLPGLREVMCREGTSAMAQALALVEQEMPGFFDPGDKPENRLLVQFTDWDLFGTHEVIKPIRRLFEAGVNMLTIAPAGYQRRSDLSGIMGQCPIQRGRNVEVVYNSMFPEAVWDEASKVLGR
jgi:hypothetical protein